MQRTINKATRNVKRYVKQNNSINCSENETNAKEQHKEIRLGELNKAENIRAIPRRTNTYLAAQNSKNLFVIMYFTYLLQCFVLETSTAQSTIFTLLSVTLSKITTGF